MKTVDHGVPGSGLLGLESINCCVCKLHVILLLIEERISHRNIFLLVSILHLEKPSLTIQ